MTTPPDSPAEFRLIARHFRPLAGPGALDLLDDAAVFAPPAGRELVVAADAMIEGVHFLPGADPERLARKLLRVNLSDLAAMGATPFGYLMTTALPRTVTDDWLARFASGLASDQRQWGLHLLGGDTTGTPGPIALSLTILGHVAPGRAVRRGGAQAGDGLWLTGTVGDGLAGLAASRGEVPDQDGYLAGRYNLPTPRLALDIGAFAHAAIDVSDGLVQEVGHLARASGLAAEISADAVPLSPALRALGADWPQRALAGGDDYELVMAVSPAREDAMRRRADEAGIAVTNIGRFAVGRGVVVRDASGAPIALPSTGWSHF